MSPKKAAYENPLIPNARLKQMYRAILRAHLLGKALPLSQRALTAGREAALVSASLDLTARDLVSDAFESPLIEWLRGTAARRTANGGRGVAQARPDSLPRLLADTGSATRILSPPDATGRLWSAIGSAASIRSTNSDAKESEDLPVVLVFALPGEISADTWKAALSFTGKHDLPIVFVVLPAPWTQKRKIDLRAVVHRAHVPAIPVDAADPVALYRAAQESIGHARIGGGPALIECVAFPAQTRGHASNAALAHLEEYILSRSIATRAWMDREASSFAARILSLKSASK